MTIRKKSIVVSLIVLLVAGLVSILIFTDFGKAFINSYKTKGALTDRETGKKSAYSFEILKMKDIKKESVKGWINRNAANEKPYTDPVYYTLYNNANEGMDMYLFMPEAKELIGDAGRSNIRVTEAGTSLMIYIDTDEKTIYNIESTDLILHIYANITSEKSKTKTEGLIINGKTYSGVSSTFMVLD